MMGVIEIVGDDGAAAPASDATCVRGAARGFNYTDANSTSRVGYSLCCDSKKKKSGSDVALVAGLVAGSLVLLCCGVGAAAARTRARRETAAEALAARKRRARVLEEVDVDLEGLHAKREQQSNAAFAPPPPETASLH